MKNKYNTAMLLYEFHIPSMYYQLPLKITCRKKSISIINLSLYEYPQFSFK